MYLFNTVKYILLYILKKKTGAQKKQVSLGRNNASKAEKWPKVTLFEKIGETRQKLAGNVIK